MEQQRIIYMGKAKDLNRKELYLSWYYGMKVPPLEESDFPAEQFDHGELQYITGGIKTWK